MCFSESQERICFIVVAPQLRSHHMSWPPDYVDEVIKQLLNGKYSHKIDFDGIFLTGISLGGHGTWEYAYSENNEPNQLKGIAPVAATGDSEMGCLVAERKINVWAFHGRKDTVVTFDKGKAMFDSVQDCQSQVSVGKTRFTIYNQSHGIWGKVYRTDHSLHDPNLYQWLLRLE